MANKVVILDNVEEAEWEGKPYLRLIDKTGMEFRLGKHLEQKYELIRQLPCGTPLELVMAKFTKDGNEIEYVKDVRKALNGVADQVANKLAPAKNIKDISIEAQCAVQCVTNVLVNGGEVPEDIKELSLEWIRRALKTAIE